ncbi:MAG: hypothetical protein GF353_21570 [Candidatus Lokiarchaeota archaeon]|nr:hypothetical protein [Candidatus Lokiarchaeota archaeon]
MISKQKEYRILIVNPKRCVDCEACMDICAFVHNRDYIPLVNRVIGKRERVEEEWAIGCDLCLGMKDKYVNDKEEKEPQCVVACPAKALFIGTIPALKNESRNQAIRRIFG